MIKYLKQYLLNLKMNNKTEIIDNSHYDLLAANIQTQGKGLKTKKT